jgi:hypothetical protein
MRQKKNDVQRIGIVKEGKRNWYELSKAEEICDIVIEMGC